MTVMAFGATLCLVVIPGGLQPPRKGGWSIALMMKYAVRLP